MEPVPAGATRAEGVCSKPVSPQILAEIGKSRETL